MLIFKKGPTLAVLCALYMGLQFFSITAHVLYQNHFDTLGFYAQKAYALLGRANLLPAVSLFTGGDTFGYKPSFTNFNFKVTGHTKPEIYYQISSEKLKSNFFFLNDYDLYALRSLFLIYYAPRSASFQNWDAFFTNPKNDFTLFNIGVKNADGVSISSLLLVNLFGGLMKNICHTNPTETYLSACFKHEDESVPHVTYLSHYDCLASQFVPRPQLDLCK